MLYPTNRFLYLALVPVVLSLLLLPLEVVMNSAPETFSAWFDAAMVGPVVRYGLRGILLFDAALLALFLFDGFLLPRRRRFQANRTTDPVYSADYPHKVQLDILLADGLLNSFRALIHDDAAVEMTVVDFPHYDRLRSGRNEIRYRLRVHRRGRHVLERVYVTLFSPLGLARKVLRIPCETELRVYPDLKAVSKYILLARKSHLGLIGVRRSRKTGGDNEFERLREYQRDDVFRHIDWKASAKKSRLITRTYQTSQNQTIVFMLDTGRMMTAEIQGHTMLDYALNSILLLARVALDQGDRVGLLAFDSRVRRYVEPGSGPGHYRALVRAGYDLFATYEESNFEQAFRYLNMVCRKRSLVTLLSNVIDEMNALMMQSYLGAISGRHLPFAVLLKYRDIQELMDHPPGDFQRLFTQAAAADFLLWRQQVIQQLKNRGVLTLESFPDKLDARLINEYLEIKARKLL